MIESHASFYAGKSIHIARGNAAVKARWESIEDDANLDAALGKTDDLSKYQDCIEYAAYQGSQNAARRTGS